MNDTKSPTYCSLSHYGVAIQNFADFCSCNVNKESWKDRRHQVINVYKDTAQNAFDSYTRRMIAAALDDGRRHPSCQACWDLEDSGNPSSRQTFNKKLSPAGPDRPRVLIIKPGNTCNLACRMCNPATSTGWYQDGFRIEGAGQTFHEYTKTFELIRNSFGRDNSEFWSTLEQWLLSLEIIDIYGGEPYLLPSMFDILERGTDMGRAGDIDIFINTNATIWNQHYNDILKRYRHVSFKMSADASTADQFEYIRHKSDFDQVLGNFNRFIDDFASTGSVDISIVITVTPLNVYYIDEIKDFFRQRFQKPVVVNLVTSPGSYDIRHLPVPVKQMLKRRVVDPTVRQFLDIVIPGCDIEWPKFCSLTDELDAIRSQSFAQTFPEWWQILRTHWGK